MAQLTIIYDETDPPLKFLLPRESEIRPGERIRHATLPLADGLEDRDVYEVARKLAELLLEQISR